MSKKKNIYLATSWRNPAYETVREMIINEGFDVYDFKNPKNSFHWFDIDKDWEAWGPDESIEALSDPKCDGAYWSDYNALHYCDILVLLNPCGKSAHLEAGFAIGAGKPVLIYKVGGDPELMYRMSHGIYSSIGEIIEVLKAQR